MRRFRFQTVALLIVTFSAALAIEGQEVTKPPAGPIAILGNVVKSRPLNARDVGLLRAIAAMGGIKNKSSAVRVMIHRGDLARGGMPIVVLLESVVEGLQQEPSLRAGDIVEVSDENGHFYFGNRLAPNPPSIWDPLLPNPRIWEPLLRRQDKSIC